MPDDPTRRAAARHQRRSVPAAPAAAPHGPARVAPSSGGAYGQPQGAHGQPQYYPVQGDGSQILTVGIVAFFCSGFILGPMADLQGNNALAATDRGEADPHQRRNVSAPLQPDHRHPGRPPFCGHCHPRPRDPRGCRRKQSPLTLGRDTPAFLNERRAFLRPAAGLTKG